MSKLTEIIEVIGLHQHFIHIIDTVVQVSVSSLLVENGLGDQDDLMALCGE